MFENAAIIGVGQSAYTRRPEPGQTALHFMRDAVVAALTPICVDKFKQASDAKTSLAALKAVDSWQRDSFVTKGGWATFPGNEPNRDVADACAKVLDDMK